MTALLKHQAPLCDAMKEIQVLDVRLAAFYAVPWRVGFGAYRMGHGMGLRYPSRQRND